MASDSLFTGNKLRRLREKKKMSRAAASRASGVEAADIERIETEELDPTFGQLRRLASALEVSLEELLSLPPSPLACEIRLTSGGEAASKAAGSVTPVPVVSGEIAAGNARIVDEAILGWLFLPREEFGRRSANLVAVQIYGASMEPDLPDGCVAVIDRNDRAITPDGIFALRDQDGGCTVKRVEVLDEEHVALIPSNRSEFKVEFWKLPAGESLGDRTIGRVVWVGYNFAARGEAAERSPLYGRPDIGLAKDLPPPSPKGDPDEDF